jgi:hypothetical protein
MLAVAARTVAAGQRRGTAMANDDAMRPATASPAGGAAGDGDAGSVEMKPLNDHYRKALMSDRMSMSKYILLIPFFILVGIGIDFLAVSHSLAFDPTTSTSLGLTVAMPAILVLLWTWYFVDNRRHAHEDLRSGTYACFTGPMTISVVHLRESNGSTTTTYKLVLGSFKTLDLDDDVAEQLLPSLPARGQADVAVQLGDVLEIRDGGGATVFMGKGLRKAMGQATPALAGA